MNVLKATELHTLKWFYVKKTMNSEIENDSCTSQLLLNKINISNSGKLDKKSETSMY